jgi:hypothetical protein
MFALMAAGHFVLVIFGIARMRARPAPRERTRYTYTPRTSFLIGRLIGKFRTPRESE